MVPFLQGNASFRQIIGPFIPSSHGDSIRERRSHSTHPNFPDPTDLYLMFITLTAGGLDVRRMWDSRVVDSNTTLQQAEEDLLRLAQGPAPTSTYLGRTFQNLAWTHPCYFTIVLDIPGWTFHWGAAAGDDTLIFQRTKPGLARIYDENYSFYNARLGNVSGYQALHCTNYLKSDAQGNDLVHPNKKEYSIDICVQLPVVEGPTIRVAIDPDGQNQGPPGVP